MKHRLNIIVGLIISFSFGQYSPCYDEIYLNLKQKRLSAMSDREYDYFTRKDIECSSRHKVDRKIYNDMASLESTLGKIQDQVNTISEIDMSSYYGMGRLNSGDPELDLLQISQNSDTRLKENIDLIEGKVSAIRVEFAKLEKRGFTLPSNLVVNSITVKDSSDGGFVKTIDKKGNITSYLGVIDTKGGKLEIYNESGNQSIALSSENGDGYIKTLDKLGNKSIRMGTDSIGSSQLVIYSNTGKKNDPVVALQLDDNGNGEASTSMVTGRPSTTFGANDKGKGQISTYHSNGSKTTLLTSTDFGDGAISLFDRDQIRQWGKIGILNKFEEEKPRKFKKRLD